jgi:hypothetical protein
MVVVIFANRGRAAAYLCITQQSTWPLGATLQQSTEAEDDGSLVFLDDLGINHRYIVIYVTVGPKC